MLKYLTDRGVVVKEAKDKIKFYRSFYYKLFYTKMAKKMVNDFLKSTGEKIDYSKTEFKWEHVLTIRKDLEKILRK